MFMPQIVNFEKYTLVVLGDEFSVTKLDEPLDDESQWTIPPTKVQGLANHVAKGVAYKIAQTEDMDIIYIIQKGDKYGYSYAINVTEPLFSEWGSSGLVVEK